MGWSSKIWFDSQTIVHGIPELLLASEIALRRLDTGVPQAEADLLDPCVSLERQLREGPPQIVRRNRGPSATM